jgi:hypothetical protein
MILAFQIAAVALSIAAAIIAIVVRRHEEKNSPEGRQLFSASDLRQPHRRYFAR